MKTTDYAGIDYGLGKTNIDPRRKTMATKIEIQMAVQCRHGAWELIGEYSSFDRARQDAIAMVHTGHDFYIDDDNGIVFGLTEDPAGGHYEARLWIDADTPSENTLMWV